MSADVHGADSGWRSGGHGFCDGRKVVGRADLERRDVGVGHVAVHILDLRQVLLGHVHKLRGAHLVGESWETLVERRRVVLLVVVLLRAARERGEGRHERGRNPQTRDAK